MSPRDFHTLASTLITTPGAAEYRTAINRAYYAVYNRGIEILAWNQIHLPHDAKSHGQLRYYFSQSGNVDLREVAGELRDLYRAREQADYYLDNVRVEGRNEASKWVSTAGRLLDRLDAFASLHINQREPAIKAMDRLFRSGR